MIQKMLAVYRPMGSNKEDENNAGRFIGTIDRIAKDKNFAEYYLLGTLLSTLIVIICAKIL